jgi:hypothetical protein
MASVCVALSHKTATVSTLPITLRAQEFLIVVIGNPYLSMILIDPPSTHAAWIIGPRRLIG